MTVLLFIDVATYSRFKGGISVVELNTAPGGRRRRVTSPLEAANLTKRAYCGDPGFFDVLSWQFQAVESRICALNMTCGAWFADREIVFADSREWFFATSAIGEASPAEPFIPITDYDLSFAQTESYVNGTFVEQRAIERSVFGNNLDFQCKPSYWIMDTEHVLLRLFHVVLVNGEDPINYPRTIMYNSQGQKFLDTGRAGVEPSFTVQQLLGEGLSLDTNVTLLSASSQQASAVPQIVSLRLIGGRSSIRLTYTNVLDGAVVDEMVCIVKFGVEGLPQAMKQDVFRRYTNLATGEDEWQRFDILGMKLQVSTTVEKAVPDWYVIFIHYLSTLILMQEFNALVMLCAVGYLKLCAKSKEDSKTPPATDSIGGDEVQHPHSSSESGAAEELSVVPSVSKPEPHAAWA